jgi:hypothetical protein
VSVDKNVTAVRTPPNQSPGWGVDFGDITFWLWEPVYPQLPRWAAAWEIPNRPWPQGWTPPSQQSCDYRSALAPSAALEVFDTCPDDEKAVAARHALLVVAEAMLAATRTF